jgi:hypothetical protein
MLDLLRSLVEEILGCKSHICSRWLTPPISWIFSKRKIPATNIHLETPPVFTPATLLVPTHCFTWTWVPASMQIEYACECKVQVHGSECHWAPELVQKWTTKLPVWIRVTVSCLYGGNNIMTICGSSLDQQKRTHPSSCNTHESLCFQNDSQCLWTNQDTLQTIACKMKRDKFTWSTYRAYQLACDITDQVFRTSMVVILNGQCWAVSSPDSCTRLCALEEMESNLLPETLVACHQHSPCDQPSI